MSNPFGLAFAGNDINQQLTPEQLERRFKLRKKRTAKLERAANPQLFPQDKPRPQTAYKVVKCD